MTCGGDLSISCLKTPLSTFRLQIAFNVFLANANGGHVKSPIFKLPIVIIDC